MPRQPVQRCPTCRGSITLDAEGKIERHPRKGAKTFAACEATGHEPILAPLPRGKRREMERKQKKAQRRPGEGIMSMCDARLDGGAHCKTWVEACDPQNVTCSRCGHHFSRCMEHAAYDLTQIIEEHQKMPWCRSRAGIPGQAQESR